MNSKQWSCFRQRELVRSYVVTPREPDQRRGFYLLIAVLEMICSHRYNKGELKRNKNAITCDLPSPASSLRVGVD